jgi:gp009
MSNPFYKSRIWRDLREEIIARDLGYDLGVPGIQIPNKQDIIVHHMIPLEEDDILEWREDIILNPDLLITTSRNTHNIIHYGDRSQSILIDRRPGDTKLW